MAGSVPIEITAHAIRRWQERVAPQNDALARATIADGIAHYARRRAWVNGWDGAQRVEVMHPRRYVAILCGHRVVTIY